MHEAFPCPTLTYLPLPSSILAFTTARCVAQRLYTQKRPARQSRCGSQYVFMPYPRSGRESARNATRWKYRWALHANLFPGHNLQFSLVPPCLKTGSNFGCSAFFSSLLGIPRTISNVVRQTDSGSVSHLSEVATYQGHLIPPAVCVPS